MGALKKCLLGVPKGPVLKEIRYTALTPAGSGSPLCFKFSGKRPLTAFRASASSPSAGASMDGEGLGVGFGTAVGYCSSLLEGSTYSELRGLMKESFKRSKPDWLVLLLRRGHLWQELLLQRQ